MALEQLSLAPAPAPLSDSPAAFNGRQTGADDTAKVPRLPRWTRQEILVLIQGKRVAENRVRRGRTTGLAFGSGQVEPKWASVSSYCKRHGVNRGPVQCRKRWSNLAGDFKKIKECESHIRDETESFWLMRNDLRRERKLPGFFDREVYDILDGRRGDAAAAGEEAAEELVLGLAPSAPAPGEDADTDTLAVFDSGRCAAADDGLFSDFEQSVQEEEEGGVSPEKEFRPAPATAVPAPAPISEQQYEPFSQGHPAQGTSYEKQPTLKPETGSTQEGKKRKRYTAEVDEEDESHETVTLHDQLTEVFERNGKLLSSQLEAQNIHLQLDREQRKDQADSLISVLNKLADALGRIADKL